MAADGSRVPGTRVLVVNGDLEAGYRMAGSLKELGYAVARACTGFEAVESNLAFGPRVVLMDLQLPLLRGADAAARIRAHGGGFVPCLVALYDPLNLQQAAIAQAPPFDAKVELPASVQALHEAILACLARERLTR